MQNDIDTIILDLGGVLIDVDYERTAKEFAALGFTDFDKLYSKAKQSDVFDHFETGELSNPGFRDKVRSLLNSEISDNEIDRCWNAMLGSIPRARLDLVERLKEDYQVLLLSNTNAIHVPEFTTIVARENGVDDFKGIFHGAYYSCEIGLRKPDVRVFQHVMNKHRIEPARTLFIDDSPQHLEGAKAAGLRAEHLDLHQEDIGDLTIRLGLLR